MRKFFAAATLCALLVCLSTPAFSQGGFFATVTGTVSDSSGALIPGVSIKATATDTSVATSVLTNEAGAYNFSNLLPGKYTLSATLPGFQTKNLTNIELSQNTAYRYNFELTVAGVNTQVEVSISADSILATSGASVGQVLNQQKVQDLPLVGNNVLNLITVLAGIENIAGDNVVGGTGRENTTFAGVRADDISIVRDGIQVQDNRYPNGVYSVTTINPDLVGEIRLILAPVDVEIGRGNGTIQYSTRSGTNRYSGSAVWTFRNTALDPNTWANNRNQSIPAGSTETVPVATPRNWNNINQGTVSFGGPIIRNKTFFFGLFDFNMNRSRALSTIIVPTPCARLGVYRYFNGWNSGNILTNSNVTSGANAIYSVVDANGTPINPLNNGALSNPGTPQQGLPPGFAGAPGTYDASLQAISVFGPLQSQPTAADCADAPINKLTLVPNGVSVTAAPGAGGGWDPFRHQFDTTGFVNKINSYYPSPNNYEAGDGLNTAGFRFLRHFRGLDNLFGSGEGTGERKQYNVKVDHNFTSNHKANVNLTYERVDSDDTVAGIPEGTVDGIPGMFANRNYRHPLVLSAGFTSTLSSTLLNEARFGLRRSGTNVVAPWDLPEFQDDLNQLFPAPINGIRVIPQITPAGVAPNLGFCTPYSGPRPPGSGCVAFTATSADVTPTYTYADTLSWTHGAHAFKFGGELRVNSSDRYGSAPGTFFGTPTLARPIFGDIPNTTPGNTSTGIGNTNPAMSGLQSTAAVGTNSNATNARTLMSYLAGSLGNITMAYFLTSPDQVDFANITDPTKNRWSDYRDEALPHTLFKQNEFNAFVKDSWKVTKDLTLHLGVRWDYTGVPYLGNGLTVGAVGGGAAAFGVSGRDFTGWMNPGIRGDVTSFQFVGPGSNNPNEGLYPNDYNNFSPGVGFAWQLPWFGEGRTVVNGGYQITYQGGGRFNALQDSIAAPPGSTLTGTPAWNGVYKDLTDLTAANIPVPFSVLPMQPNPLVGPRNSTLQIWDPNYATPYVQNLTLSVTRTMSRNITLDLRYVGTLSRKNFTTLALNTNNYLYNGLLEALTDVRAGTELTKTSADPKDLLNQIYNGVNICSTAGSCSTLPAGQTYGPVGTTTNPGGPNALFQSAALHLRSNTAYQTDLANGNFNNVANTISRANAPGVSGSVGGILRGNGFPENFITTNPQFQTTTYNNNSGYSNYHSLQVQTSLRPVQGFSGQVTYSWSKNLGLPPTLTDPTNRALDYTNINNNPGHSLRTNGTVELPFGPNKLIMGNSSGWLARAVERWQLALIYNLSSGAPTSITATSMLYANGVPDSVYPVDFNAIKGVRWGIPNNTLLEGRYFDNNDMFVKVDDPQCLNVTPLNNLSGLVPLTGAPALRCSLDALAMAVAPGTPGAIDRAFADGSTKPSVIVLQHPQPGKRGTLGQNTINGLGTWRFDANLGKTFRITESKSLQVRFDAQNVLNHPQPANPTLSITGNDYFGRINTKAGTRAFQGQLRFSF